MTSSQLHKKKIIYLCNESFVFTKNVVFLDFHISTFKMIGNFQKSGLDKIPGWIYVCVCVF